jgi:hypothetical protein
LHATVNPPKAGDSMPCNMHESETSQISGADV